MIRFKFDGCKGFVKEVDLARKTAPLQSKAKHRQGEVEYRDEGIGFGQFQSEVESRMDRC
ncbi:hypothetical protein P872_18530 [Rhodonellum psychrophilum GCM71 = DSM 17998]|uniref:Uncharacterized protein n=1 Tax=Rhodonellum psychrophilum GCM71 = DSM 17998 TaxID=1123057 RepID=U5C284_9BACT|nr:hypothetical protein P872_18530 [Rhodonellum psychrophilum GCM71 = DSM 17998]